MLDQVLWGLPAHGTRVEKVLRQSWLYALDESIWGGDGSVFLVVLEEF